MVSNSGLANEFGAAGPLQGALVACHDTYASTYPGLITPTQFLGDGPLRSCVAAAIASQGPRRQPVSPQAAATLSALQARLDALRTSHDDGALAQFLSTNPYMVDFRNGGTKLQSLSTGPGPSPLPVAPAGPGTQGATAATIVAPPPQSQSYYETWGEACSTVACSACNTSPCTDLIGEGNSAIPYALPIIEIGGACGYEGVYSYGGPCLDQRQLIYAALGWAFGFIANSNHANQWGAVAVGMNNAGDSDPTTEYDNGAYFYLNLARSLYGYVALLNAYNANHAYVVVGGADVETGAGFRGPSPSLNWLNGFNIKEYFQSFNGQPQYQMVVNGDSTNTCGTASCFYSTGYGDAQGWTPDDVLDGELGVHG